MSDGVKKFSALALCAAFVFIFTLTLFGCGSQNENVTEESREIIEENGGVEDRIQKMIIVKSDYTYDGEAIGDVRNIVVHYTANPGSSALANRNYFNSLASKRTIAASAHFIVGLEGEIIQCVPLDCVSWANGNMESNRHSITIECCHPTEDGHFNEKTLASLRELVAWLCEKYSLGKDDIIRHYDVTGKDCPRYFVANSDKWEAFLNSVFDGDMSGEEEYGQNEDDGLSNFEIFIRWGIFGISSYNSATGELIKTTDVETRSPDDYKTTLVLSSEQKRRIYKIIKELDIESYPDSYDPFATEHGSVYSSPSVTIILAVGDKIVVCRGISIGQGSESEKGQKFLGAVYEIISIITSTDEWQALPDYEVLYY